MIKPELAIPVTGDLRIAIEEHLVELFKQLLRKPGYPKNPWALERVLRKITEGDFPEWPDSLEVVDIEPLPGNRQAVIARLKSPPPDMSKNGRRAPCDIVLDVCNALRAVGLDLADFSDLHQVTNGGKSMITAPWDGRRSVRPGILAATQYGQFTAPLVCVYDPPTGICQPSESEISGPLFPFIWWLCTRRTTTE